MRPVIAVLIVFALECTVCGLLPALASELAAGQTVSISRSENSVEFRFRGMTLTSAEPSADGFELTLRFQEPVKDTLAQELSARSKDVLSYATAGYDTVLLRSVRPSRFGISDSDGGFTLHLDLAAESGDPTRLALVEIRRRTMIDDTPGARSLLSELRQGKPDNAELLRLEADIDLADRDNRTAALKYRRLLRDHPSDASLRDSLSSAESDFAPRVDAGADYQEIEGGDRQWRGHIYGQTPLSEVLDLRGRIEFVELDDDLVQFSDATVGTFHGGRQRGELTLAYDFGTRWEGRASLYGGNETIGGGLGFEYQDADSTFIVSAGYHQPSWDYTESIVANGARDFIAGDLQQSFDDRWFFNMGLGLHRFALDGDTDTAVSMTIQSGLRWQLPLESPTKVSIGYSFDAEYVDSVSLHSDGMGGTFAPLPIDDRVVHSADLRVAEQLSPQFFVAIYAGFAKELNGSDGIIAGAELAYEPMADLRIALNANYSDVSSRAGESGAATHAGLTITRAFALPSGDVDGK